MPTLIRYKLLMRLIAIALYTPSLAQSSIYQKFAVIQQSSKGKLGIFARLVETNDTISFNGYIRFPMQSVYKVPINMVVLKAIDQHKLHMNQQFAIPISMRSRMMHSEINNLISRPGIKLSLFDLLYYNAVESDGIACDMLIHIMGGTRAVNKSIRESGIKGIEIATTEKMQSEHLQLQYQNWTLPKSAVELLDTLYRGHFLTTRSRNLLLQQMQISTPHHNRIKKLLPSNIKVFHKSGTSRTEANGLTGATNDIGILCLPNGKHVIIAIFLSNSYNDRTSRDKTISQVAHAVYKYWHP